MDEILFIKLCDIWLKIDCITFVRKIHQGKHYSVETNNNYSFVVTEPEDVARLEVLLIKGTFI